MTSSIAECLIHCLRVTVAYGDKLTTDIPAEEFAHIPHPGMNHPAFCIGHLSLYPNELLRLLGRQKLIIDKEGFLSVFRSGTQCVEQDGRYPPKQDIVDFYLERHYVLSDAIADVGDELLDLMERPPHSSFKRWFPTAGAALVYYLNNHHMQHLGQLSAWRRVMGLRPLKWGDPDAS